MNLEHETTRLLDAVDRLLVRFVAFPSNHDRHAVAAWVLHTWTLDAFESTPRLALLSPEKGSGKTRTLEVLELVVPNPKHTVNMSAPALFRIVGGEDRATLLMDEADTYLGWKVAREHEDVRGLVNAGHRRGAVAYRVSVEKGITVQEFPAFAAVALAGIGDLPDTILDRSVVVSMKRRAPCEQVDPFRRRHVEPTTVTLTEALEGWAAGAVPALEAHLESIDLPAGIEDRPADVWEALVAIGDLASETWSVRLRQAAVTLNGQREERDPSLGVQLLKDVRATFERLEVDRIASAKLAEELAGIEGAPWSNLRGVPIDANGIARRLKPYSIRPAAHWIDGATHRGYLREDFYDAWMRYLPPPPEDRNTRKDREDEAAPALETCPNLTDLTALTPYQGEEGATCVECSEPATATDLDGSERCGSCVSWGAA
jgi:hypothetical protein